MRCRPIPMKHGSMHTAQPGPAPRSYQARSAASLWVPMPDDGPFSVKVMSIGKGWKTPEQMITCYGSKSASNVELPVMKPPFAPGAIHRALLNDVDPRAYSHPFIKIDYIFVQHANAAA